MGRVCCCSPRLAAMRFASLIPRVSVIGSSNCAVGGVRLFYTFRSGRRVIVLDASPRSGGTFRPRCSHECPGISEQSSREKAQQRGTDRRDAAL
jgi:hypothetical protein